jgi:hypothetical protein
MAGRDDPPSGPTPPGHRVFFEFTQVGQQMRVVAIDEATGTEVVAIAPVTATSIQLQQLALAKLRRKLGAAEEPPKPPTAGKWA